MCCSAGLLLVEVAMHAVWLATYNLLLGGCELVLLG